MKIHCIHIYSLLDKPEAWCYTLHKRTQQNKNFVAFETKICYNIIISDQ